VGRENPRGDKETERQGFSGSGYRTELTS